VKDSFNSYPLDCLAIAGAVAAIEDDAWFQATRRRIVASRESLAHALSGLGFEVLPSMANFVFARHVSRGGAELAAGLRERGVLVRHFQKPRIDRIHVTDSAHLETGGLKAGGPARPAAGCKPCRPIW
jgi:histidinol-phosphate aminotransferase